jgi:hypothetical protein
VLKCNRFAQISGDAPEVFTSFCFDSEKTTAGILEAKPATADSFMNFLRFIIVL